MIGMSARSPGNGTRNGCRARIVALRVVRHVSITRRPSCLGLPVGFDSEFASSRWFCSQASLGRVPVAVAAANVTVSNERFSDVGATIAGCNGEDLFAQFHVHNVDVLVFNGAGGATVRSHQDVHGTAIGSLGNTYVLAGIQANSTIINPDALGLREFTVTNQLHNVSRGGADNLLVIAVTHITLNANGEVTSEVINFETRCVG
jgi:hypothetical protein